MLKDMTDSKRIDQHIQSQKKVSHLYRVSRAGLTAFWTVGSAPNHHLATFLATAADEYIHNARATQTVRSSYQPHFNVSSQPSYHLGSIQEEYAQEFTVFKPDKKLVWMSHLGTINLEIELDDRTIEAEVPPLEAAFIELFSEQGVFPNSITLPILRLPSDEWSVPDLIAKLGTIERPAAIKALTTWIELGVLKEDSVDHYRLLKTAEPLGTTGKAVGKQIAAAPAVEELPPVLTVQQQQAEQMKVFWKVSGAPAHFPFML